jgi:hypothetical protein
MDYILSPKVAKKYYCETCDYRCSKESDYNKHLMTRKHKKSYCGVTLDNNKSPKIPEYECECGNTYKFRQGLWKHKKKCSMHQGKIKEDTNTEMSTTNYEIDKELLVKMLLKNQDVMEKLAEVMPQIGNQSHNTNSLNTTNNQFNIQMFLNEHCKNAMNLTDFIDSLPITSDTYDSTIENGLTKTITNMLLNGLNELDVLDRPIHCTDASRKTLYVKDDNVWEKDNELLHMIKGIRELSLKQRTMIQKWQDVNEGWLTDENLQSRLTKLIGNSMTAIESDDKETGKIIRSISKNVYLDKDTKEQYLQ